MENVSKALIIAGGILIALIIVSAGVGLYISLNKTSEDYSTKPEIASLQTFNLPFEKLNGKTDINVQDVISVYNYIQEQKNKVPHQVILNVKNDNKYPSTGKFVNEKDKMKYISNCNYTFSFESIRYKDGQVVEINLIANTTR